MFLWISWPFEWCQVMMELRRIHMKVYERGRRQSLSVACQPVMSWKAFQEPRRQEIEAISCDFM